VQTCSVLPTDRTNKPLTLRPNLHLDLCVKVANSESQRTGCPTSPKPTSVWKLTRDLGAVLRSVARTVVKSSLDGYPHFLMFACTIVLLAQDREMTEFSFNFLVVVLLLISAKQVFTQSAPSVADAARASREHQKSAKPKHVLTNDDFGQSDGTEDSEDVATSAAQLRIQMEKSYPVNPTAADLKSEMDRLGIYAKIPEGELLGKFKREALYGYEDVNFPGKEEWEQQLTTAVAHFIAEGTAAASRIGAILEQSQVCCQTETLRSCRRCARNG